MKRIFLLFTLVIVFLFFYCVFLTWCRRGQEGFENPTGSNKRFDLVVARYKEDISYLTENPIFEPFHIIVYNKGDAIENPAIQERCQIIQLPNVGKCDHTYLYHIIQNYENLADVTAFLPASFYYMDDKRDKAFHMIRHTISTQDSAYPVIDVGQPIQEDPEFKNFILDTWETSFSANKDEKNYELLPATTRPFGTWMEKHIPNNKCPYFMYHGIFSSSKEDIQHTSRETYEIISSEVDHHKNPEAGHYIERAWISFFYPIRESTLLK